MPELLLALSFYLAQLIDQRFSLRSIKTTLLCGLASLVPMLPFAFNYFGNTNENYHPSPEQFKMILEGLSYRIPSVTAQVMNI